MGKKEMLEGVRDCGGGGGWGCVGMGGEKR